MHWLATDRNAGCWLASSPCEMIGWSSAWVDWLIFQSPDFLEALLKFQGSRLDDQRCLLPLPLQDPPTNHSYHSKVTYCMTPDLWPVTSDLWPCGGDLGGWPCVFRSVSVCVIFGPVLTLIWPWLLTLYTHVEGAIVNVLESLWPCAGDLGGWPCVSRSVSVYL